jgi:hypothetical protein
MLLVAFLIQLVVYLAIGPLPSRERLSVVTGTVKEVTRSSAAKDKYVDAYNLVVALDDGRIYVGGIGNDKTMAPRDRALLGGRKVELTIDPNRILAIKLDGREVLPYEVGRAYWERDWAGETEFLHIMLAATVVAWSGLGVWQWISLRRRTGDRPAREMPRLIWQGVLAYPYLRQLLAIAAIVLVTFGMIGVLVAASLGKRCPDSFALPALGVPGFWLVLSLLWLIRSVPRDQPLPAWVGRFGLVDVLLGAGLAVCGLLAARAHGACT